MSIAVEILPADQWAVAVAGAWLQRLAARPDLVQCVASGLTPKPVYAAMAGHAAAFSRSTVFLLDEFGGMAPGHPARSAEMVRTDLISRVNMRADGFVVPDVDGGVAAVDAVAEAYDRAIVAAGGLGLAIVGIGTNGHIGMNEPGSDPRSPTRRVELAASTSAATARCGAEGSLPTWGLTVGLGPLRDSHEIWVLATGSSKAEAVHAALRGPVTTDCPASLLQDHPRCTFWLDDAAASLLG